MYKNQNTMYKQYINTKYNIRKANKIYKNKIQYTKNNVLQKYNNTKKCIKQSTMYKNQNTIHRNQYTKAN